MTTIGHDLRHAVRGLRRSPGYTALCVAALALGIGANGAIFSLVDTLMLRPLPYPHPDRLALAFMTSQGGNESLASSRLTWSYPKYETFAQAQTAFDEVAGFVGDSVNLTGAGEPERLELEMVSPAYFHVLGVRPSLGRTLARQDARPGAPVVALLAEGLWRRRFGGDPEMLGRTVRLGPVPVTVVGIVPTGFRGLTGNAELWVPVTAADQLWYPGALAEPHNHYLEVVGRVKAGVSRQQLDAEMTRLGKLVATAFPASAEDQDGSVWSAGAMPLAEARRDPVVRRALVVLLAAVGAVLLIACANLAGLAMTRAANRRRDLAIRRAMGASAARLVRRSLLESLLLAATGFAVGLLPAAWLVRGLTAVRPEALGTWGVSSAELYDLAHAGIDLRVVSFCAAMAVATALLVGLAPAVAAGRVDLGADLRAGGAALVGRRPQSGLGRSGDSRGLLVAGQVALAMVLLTGAGLLIRSLWALQHVTLGFRPERVLTFRVSPSSGRYTAETAGGFHARLLERLQNLPGVEHAALGTCIPASGVSGCNSTIVQSVDGRELAQASAPVIGWHKVTGAYFRALGVPLLAGRTFDGRDRDGARRVVILNETAARRLFPGVDPVGRRIQMGTMGLNGDVHGEIVGVVGDVRYRRLEDEPRLEAYLPDSQVTLSATTAFLRTPGDPLAIVPAVRAAVGDVDADLPVYRVRTLEEQLGFALSKARFGSLLLLAFALLALALASLGVYGVLAQSVGARRREIGLRMALGAAAGQVERLVLRQGMAVALAGALAGVALSLALTGSLRALLYEVPARDPWTLLAVGALLLLVALAACLGPARRAARVDPMSALRVD